MTPEEKQEKARVNRIMSKGPIDLPFALLVLLLTAIGVLMVFSASFARAYYEASDPSAMAALSVFLRQAGFAVVGMIAMFVVSKIDYHKWRRWAVPILILAIILLVLVIIPHNPLAITRNNATRWLGVNGFSFQPSELGKTILILLLAFYFSTYSEKVLDRSRPGRCFRYGVVFPCCFLLLYCFSYF